MRLLTNPGSNLSAAQLDRYRVMLLPQRIVVDGTAHDTRERVIGFAEVDGWVATAERWPSTIGTTAAETISAYQQAVRDGDRHIMVVTTSKKIINSYEAAVVASQTFLASPQGKGVKIAVVDTGVTDIGAMLVCLLVGEAMRAKLPWEEIEAIATTASSQTRLTLSLATLDNMVKGGRASFLKRFVADVLGVRPILAFMPDGAISSAGTYKKRGESCDKLMEWITSQIEPGRRVWAATLHTQDEAPAAVLAERLHRTYDVAASFRAAGGGGCVPAHGTGCRRHGGLPHRPPGVEAPRSCDVTPARARYLPGMPRPRLVTDLRIPIDLEETSDVVALAGGAFLVVSDVDSRAAIVARDRRTTFLDIPGLRRGDSALEAVSWDAAAGLLVSYAEDHGELLIHRWDGVAGSAATLVERREIRFGKRKNKGVEGIGWMGGRILCANEGKPRALFLLGAADEDPVEVEMDPAIDDVCEDLSGLAHDPGRGSWLLVSDESATLVEIALDDGPRPSTRLLGAWDLHDERGDALERVEGVAVDAEGAWWVLLEDEHELCRVRAPSPR